VARHGGEGGEGRPPADDVAQRWGSGRRQSGGGRPPSEVEVDGPEHQREHVLVEDPVFTSLLRGAPMPLLDAPHNFLRVPSLIAPLLVAYCKTHRSA
jgi:hypothetical protein